MTTHTPGPWEARRTGDRWEVVSGTANFEDLSGIVVGWVEVSRPGFSSPRDAADARLFAAAPALLAFSEKALAGFEALERSRHEPATDQQKAAVTELQRLISEARAAIAATRGGALSGCSGCEGNAETGHRPGCKMDPPGSMLARAIEEQQTAKTFVIFAHAYNAYWGPNRCGYGSLLSAGLYTEEEARKQQKRRPQVDRAVPLAEAVGRIESVNPEILAAIARGLR